MAFRFTSVCPSVFFFSFPETIFVLFLYQLAFAEGLPSVPSNLHVSLSP